MEIGRTFYAKDRKAWRKWLKENHKTKKDIWLIFYKKHSGKRGVLYNAAVEEALCFGWIDSTVKRIDEEKRAQRFTPRNKKSPLSEMNMERARRLIKAKKMTKAGLAVIGEIPKETFVIPPDIMHVLRNDRLAWENFEKFPQSYKRIRIGWIVGAKSRPEEFEKRLRYFLKMTRRNKRFGMVQ